MKAYLQLSGSVWSACTDPNGQCLQRLTVVLLIKKFLPREVFQKQFLLNRLIDS